MNLHEGNCAANDLTRPFAIVLVIESVNALRMLHLLAITSGGAVFTADEVLSPYVYVFIVAYFIAFIFTPIMRAVAIYYGIVDQPDQLRGRHPPGHRFEDVDLSERPGG